MFEVSVATKKGTKVSSLICSDSECFLGKGDECLIPLHGWKVARRHIRFYNDSDGVHLEWNGQGAPVTVNGKKVEQYGPLNRDDRIEIHSYRITIQSHGNRKASSSAPGPDAEGGAGTTSSTLPQQVNTESKQVAELAQPSEQDQELGHRWREYLHRQLIEQLDLRRLNTHEMNDTQLRDVSSEIVTELVQELEEFPAELDRDELARQVLDEAVGLGPLEGLLDDKEVTEVMVNSAEEIFYEKAGRLYKSPITFTNDQAVHAAIERIVAPIGRRIDESSPMVDARLKDGSRVNAVIPPLALKGPCITIRKFPEERLTPQNLIEFGSISAPMMEFLQTAVNNRCNVIISGGTGSGKTTLLNVLSGFIPDDERIITVEDAAELKLHQPNLISLEARPPNQEGKGAIVIRDLIRNCLRMRPDRIVVGECRGGEALDMLQAMNTGHDGSLTTIHSNSPRDCLSRLEVMVMMSGMDLPVQAIREQIASATDIIIQQTRFSCGTRKVTSITEVSGVEGGRVQSGELFRFEQQGYDENGKVQGKLVSTGHIPELYENLRDRGISVDLSMFTAGEAV
ncbi:ATPase, T2SS/T4P/T4SS family [Vreelandella utahensis]|uniref:ATPase, T2SS/T4P/T4SS family n=1 Tax=Vreelandella halophila TaxID=86177 RepID=UPI0009865CF2|nr:ATPase, T2SS/T4P/T4SS family [Halomonas utahensis]